MATKIFLGDPPPSTKQWILKHTESTPVEPTPTVRTIWYATILPTAQGSSELTTELSYDKASMSENANIWRSGDVLFDDDMTKISLTLKQTGTTWTVVERRGESSTEVQTLESESEPESISFERKDYSCTITPDEPSGEPLEPSEPLD
jgi:hypothetical protein